MIARREEGEDVAVATNDFGLELKAKQRGVDVITPPEEARLPDVLGEEEKKFRQLEAELQAERARRPKLRLVFDECRSGHLEVTLAPALTITPEETRTDPRGI
jgi:hypothetical protein